MYPEASARSFQGCIRMPRRPVMSPPVLNAMSRGKAFAKSLAGETTLAAMFTARVATTAVNIEIGHHDRLLEAAHELDGVPDRLPVDDDGRARDEHAHGGEDGHRGGQGDHLAHHLLALAAPEAREVGHVQGERRPVADHRGQGRDEDGQELAEAVELPGLAQERSQAVRLLHRPDEQHRRHHEHEGRGPVLDHPQEVHPLVDDEDVHAPEEQEREPFGRGVAAEARPQEVAPSRGRCWRRRR